jgi:hypothetical protein
MFSATNTAANAETLVMSPAGEALRQIMRRARETGQEIFVRGCESKRAA